MSGDQVKMGWNGTHLKGTRWPVLFRRLCREYVSATLFFRLVLLQGLPGAALLLADVAVVDEGVWEVAALDVVPGVAPAAVGEGPAQPAAVAGPRAGDELVQVGRDGGHEVAGDRGLQRPKTRP